MVDSFMVVMCSYKHSLHFWLLLCKQFADFLELSIDFLNLCHIGLIFRLFLLNFGSSYSLVRNVNICLTLVTVEFKSVVVVFQVVVDVENS